MKKYLIILNHCRWLQPTDNQQAFPALAKMIKLHLAKAILDSLLFRTLKGTAMNYLAFLLPQAYRLWV